MSSATVSNFLHQASLFSKEVLSQPDARLRLRRSLVARPSSNAEPSLSSLQLAAETLDRAILAPDSDSRLDLLDRAEELLLSALGGDPHTSAVAFLHLAVVSTLRGNPVRSARFLLDAFASDPSSARGDLAPKVWEESLVQPLLPLHRLFYAEKQAILASVSSEFQDRQGSMSALDFSFTSESLAFDEASRRQLLSRMSNETVEELRMLEDAYEEALDENTKLLANFLREFLENSEGKELTNTKKKKKKKFFVPVIHKVRGIRVSGAEKLPEKTGDAGFRDGRYNDGMHGDTSFCERKRGTGEQAETSCSLGLLMDASDHGSTTHQPVLSTDFLYPITGQVFDDQVTLETGQTYERSAIQEWIEGGRKDICPIKHQKLSATILPKTNCVLKDLNANWREKNAGSAKETKVLVQSKYESPEIGLSGSMKLKHSSSEISVTSQVDGIVPELTSDISKLWLSGSLHEIENSVLAIKRAWGNADADNEIRTSLAKPDVVSRLVEILFNSLDIRVLRTTIYLLSELVARDETVMQTLMQSYPNILEKVVVLLKKGIFEAATLISLLRPSWASLVAMDLIHSLLAVVKAAVQEGSEQPRMYLRPKTAAILLLMEVLKGDDGNVHKVGGAVIAEKALENVVSSLESDRTEERIAAIRILLNCIKEKGSCRRIIADKVNLSSVFGIFMSASVAEKFEIVGFLSELVRINRTCSEQLLQKMKDEASFSLMHGLLLYLQTALLDQCPVIAGLLLQLDLLAEPRKMSIYREEAIDVLISCLRDSTSPTAQIAAAEAIIALPGRFSASGKPLTRSLLLKRAGIDKNLRAMMQRDQRCLIESAVVDNLEEEKAVKWEKKMAFALVSHEFGLIFEALGEGLKNSYKELSARCFVSATWLASILGELPDTGVRGAARICLLELFISNFKSAQEVEERALAMLAMNSFIHDPDGFQVLTSHMRDILKKLRELKEVSSLSAEMIKALTGQQEPNAGIWFHKELFQMSCSMNGGVLAMNCYRDLIFSGHSDGTIKVWGIEGSRLHLIQETREHSKSVTSLEVLQNNGRLYSGSLDKSIRVWSVGVNRIECVEVHNVKDVVHGLAVANAVACFITQGPGVKVHPWNGISNLVIANKHVRCIRLVHGRLYCGCNDGSIQEVDLATGTSITIQPATRKLIGKTNPIYTLEVGDGFLYSSHASLDGGPTVKMWTTASYTTVGSLVPTADVRSLAITSELIYLGCRTGSIEVWSRENHRRVGTLETRTNSKVLCMSLHANGEVLVLGTADGQIQAWEIS
ncbi:putative E3 ubiquitin-protein ligase LIN isoform X2 [Nymphaea colorata]|uniref:putative E3 ubiquitin-protein ligase LIN isoform X2 n=1 Tax=Nymphaea colorata TaxID=210225 RepID=UPI00129ED458|nr:putative E3 ubiquitin-protein ligase LIN isoform X2 [Nymphaea colorata]